MIGSLATFHRRLLSWYDQHQRALPWRTATPDPYHTLVSEAMLQQTQVATVVPYFHRFLDEFPTIAALAAADEQRVLRLWQGLGYYSRARNLQRAAQKIIAEFSGRIPDTVEALLELPGVGRYTAGAICSIAFNGRAAILDGNVARVICRLDAVRSNPREKKTREKLWERAEAILPKRRLGDFNSALMELGALVCVPRTPKCLICPVRAHCEAFAQGIQNTIPPAKLKVATPLHRRLTFAIRHKDKFLIERRPDFGRWAGMWQFVTLENENESIHPNQLLEAQLSLRADNFRSLGHLCHALTHRRYEFELFICEATEPLTMSARRWVSLAGLKQFPLPKPHVQMAEILKMEIKKQRPGNESGPLRSESARK